MKKKFALMLALLMSMSLFTACGDDDDDDDSSSKKKSKTTTSASTEADEDEDEDEDEEEETKEKKTTEAKTTEEETTEEKTTEEETTEEEEPTEFTPVEGLSDKYVDFDNRAFAYDGTVFTLGESTLGDLIDGGVPFKSGDLKNKDEDIDRNYETGRYTVDVNDHVSIQCVFFNNTDDTVTAADCILCEVRYCTFYVPKDSYDDKLNKEIKACIKETAEQYGFSFPLDLKKDQLLESCPDGEADDFNNVDYKVKSDVYYGSSGYSFSFDKDTDQLKQVYITWLP